MVSHAEIFIAFNYHKLARNFLKIIFITIFYCTVEKKNGIASKAS